MSRLVPWASTAALLLVAGCGWENSADSSCDAATAAFTSQPANAAVFMNDEPIGIADGSPLDVCAGTQTMWFVSDTCEVISTMLFDTGSNAETYVEVCPADSTGG